MIDRIPNPPAGMLRRGSPVQTSFRIIQHQPLRGVFLRMDADRCVVAADEYGERFVSPDRVALDLTDATGRAHLAAWIRGQGYDLILPAARYLGLSGNERERLFEQARNLEDMTPPQIDTLARLALRVMGRTE